MKLRADGWGQDIDDEGGFVAAAVDLQALVGVAGHGAFDSAGAEPQAEGNLKPARGDEVSATAVKPGKLQVTVADPGPAVALTFVTCPAAGAVTNTGSTQ